MSEYASIFFRAWLIVFFTSANVSFLARWRKGQIDVKTVFWTALTGFGISAVWWFNSYSAAHSGLPGAWFVYATGAMTGTLTGATAARRL